jgi:hypothetical protein
VGVIPETSGEKQIPRFARNDKKVRIARSLPELSFRIRFSGEESAVLASSIKYS